MRLVGEYISLRARRTPDKSAIIDGAARLTYRELETRANRVANALIRAGFGHGDRIGILANASADWIIAYLGIVKMGGIAVPCNYRETSEAIGHFLRDSGCRLVFSTGDRESYIPAGSGVERVVRLEATGRDGLAAFSADASDAVPAVPASPDDGNVIIYTGGTTGVSKGVLLTHANLFWNVMNQVIDTHMVEDDNTLLATALHHSAALNSWLLPHLYLGATATLLREFSPEGWLETAARERVTNGFTPPTMARQIFTHPRAERGNLPAFRRWYLGAGILPRQDRARMAELCPGVGIYYEYGLSEAGPIVTCLRDADYERAPDSIGRPVLHADVKILREDLSEAPAGEVGEIAVRGPAVMPGYYNRPRETAASFAKGWLRTGDLGAMDEAGFVFFHDRLKDMIKTAGLNVYSQQVEYVLSKHPVVREVAVLGMPDEKWGEKVTAVITLHDGQRGSEEELIAYCRERLAGYQTPKSIVFMAYDDVPKNYLGKILKRELRRQLAAAPSP